MSTQNMGYRDTQRWILNLPICLCTCDLGLLDGRTGFSADGVQAVMVACHGSRKLHVSQTEAATSPLDKLHMEGLEAKFDVV